MIRGRSSVISRRATRGGPFTVAVIPPKWPGLGRERSDSDRLATASIFHRPSSCRKRSPYWSVPPRKVWPPPESETEPRPVAPIVSASLKRNGTPVAGVGAATVPALKAHVWVPIQVLYALTCALNERTPCAVARQSAFRPQLDRDWLRGPS